MQSMEAFLNTSAFGALLTNIRLFCGNVSREDFARRGGPSERHQQNAESGKDMTITVGFLSQCGEAADQLTRNKYSFKAEFLPAVSAAYSAAEKHPGALEWDSEALHPGAGFNLGRDFPRKHVLTAGKLSYPALGGAEPSLAHYFAQTVDEAMFVKTMMRVANRHKALTLVPWAVADAADIVDKNPWPSHMTCRVGLAEGQGYDRVTIDPLADVSSLEGAYRRAAKFGAKGADRAHLAWAILLANADAAATSEAPMTSWMSLFDRTSTAASDRWSELLKKLQTDTKLAPTISITDIRIRANQFILPWAEEWLVATGLHILTISGTEGPQVGWGLERQSKPSNDSVPDRHYAGSRMWFYDEPSLPTLPAILRDQQVANLVLQSTSLTAAESQAPEFIWCPVGAGDGHVVVQEAATGRWRAAQLF